MVDTEKNDSLKSKEMYGYINKYWNLPPLGADSTKITTNGMGSGGFMAMQVLVVFSDLFAGAELEMSGSYASLKYLTEKFPRSLEKNIKEDYNYEDYLQIYKKTIKEAKNNDR